MRRRMKALLVVAGLAAAPVLSACSGPTTPKEARFTMQGEGPWTGTFEYVRPAADGSWTCTWDPADPDTGPRDFACGTVSIELGSGDQLDDLQDLWEDIDPIRIDHFASDGMDGGHVRVALRIGDEHSALQAANDHPVARDPSLVWTGVLGS